MDESFVVGVVVGASIVGLVWILVPLTRRIRAESGMDPELQARTLLGEPPDDEPPASASEPPEHRDFDPGELRALRNLGKGMGGKRSKKAR